ncbi:hypothetical protein V8N76_004581 [Salmonella enterica]
MSNKYVIFHRTWWKENADWPDGLEPCAAPPKFVKEVTGTENDARAACRAWNETHPAGRLSDKAEYQDATSYYEAWGHRPSATK